MMTTFVPNKHRRSIRLPAYDYSQEGAYYVTICVENRRCLFGDVAGGQMRLSDLGQIAGKFWQEIPVHYQNIILDEYVIMPNHIHGIIIIADACRGVKFNAPTNARSTNRYSQISPKSGTLSVIIRTYKSAVTHWCKDNRNPHFQWPRNYYEHIIRNEKSLNKIRQYILENPYHWDSDEENPQNIKLL
ncbi:MAG: transposase [Candidatus Edwardsbacteria bacterium]